MIQNRFTFIFLVFILFIGISPSNYAKDHANRSTFITVADIHFDPFAGCSKKQKPCVLLNKLEAAPYQNWESIFEQYGDKRIADYFHDTNYLLLKTTLNELKRLSNEKQPVFIFVLGDFLAHDFREDYVTYSNKNSAAAYREFIKKTLQFLTYEIQSTFPNIDVYPVVGNNDSYTGDYSVIPNGEFLKDTMQTWSLFFKDKSNRESFQSTFAKAGYYEVTVSNNKQYKIIVLDTVLFSTNAPPGDKYKSAALEELHWLQEQLAAAARQHQKVILAFHIPNGIDVYATVTNNFKIKEYWQAIYTQKFETELQQFAGTITAILPAHIHIDTFQVMVHKRIGNIPVYFTPSISPIFGNNPGFKVFQYDKESFQITHIDTHFYPLNSKLQTWQKEYASNQFYPLKCDNCILITDIDQLKDDKKVSLCKKILCRG